MKAKAETGRTCARLALTLLLFYLLQSAVFSRLRLWGVAPLLLPYLAVGAGLFGGGIWGPCVGLAAGLLCDLSLGEALPLFTVILPCVGFFTGFLVQFVLARGFPSFLLLSACTLALCAFIQMLRYLFFSGVPALPLLLTACKQTLYSLLAVLPAYACVRRAFRPLLRAR